MSQNRKQIYFESRRASLKRAHNQWIQELYKGYEGYLEFLYRGRTEAAKTTMVRSATKKIQRL